MAFSTRENQPGQRLAKLAADSAAEQAKACDYRGEDERTYVQALATFVAGQAQRLTQLVADAATQERQVSPTQPLTFKTFIPWIWGGSR